MVELRAASTNFNINVRFDRENLAPFQIKVSSFIYNQNLLLQYNQPQKAANPIATTTPIKPVTSTALATPAPLLVVGPGAEPVTLGFGLELLLPFPVDVPFPPTLTLTTAAHAPSYIFPLAKFVPV